MTPTKVDLTIYQGATFRWPFYWYSDAEVVKPITAIARSYPTTLTAVAHDLPDSPVPVALLDTVTGVDTASLDPADRIYATKVDADTFTIKVNSTDFDAYSGSAGRLVYNAPVDLTGWTARMQIRESIDDALPLIEFTTEDGRITLGADGLVEITLTPEDTDALDFASAVYDLELIEPVTTDVTRLAFGNVQLSPQVTRSA